MFLDQLLWRIFWAYASGARFGPAYALGIWFERMVWAYGLGVWFGRMVWAYALSVWFGRAYALGVCFGRML